MSKAQYIILVIGIAFTFPLLIWLRFHFAKLRAIRDHEKEVLFFGGYWKMVFWEPNEGLVILKNKRIFEVIPKGEKNLNNQGGIKVISAFRGEELKARLPLTLRLISWEDENILTRESIKVRMKVSLWWQIKDLEIYAFNIDKGVHLGAEHRDLGLLEAAEKWLQTLTESSMRMLVSRASIATLVSSRATSYLQVADRHDGHLRPDLSVSEGTPEAIAGELHRNLTVKTKDYGIDIQRVEIQEINLSKEIQEAIDRVWQATLAPVESEQRAKARQIELEALAKVIGSDATGAAEILKNFQGASFYGPPPFLDAILQKTMMRGNGPPALEQKTPPALPKPQPPPAPGDELKN